MDSLLQEELFLSPITIDFNILEPQLTSKQMMAHYNGHYLKYIKKFNKLLKQDNKLKEIYCLIKKNTDESIFRNTLLLTINEIFDKNSDIVHNACQIYNHELYWKTLVNIDNSLNVLCKYRDILFKEPNSFDIFYKKYIEKGCNHFGSGWLWLILVDDHIDVITTHDATIPTEHKILGCIDLWEHAYYVDYESSRRKYLVNIFKNINWCSFIPQDNH